MRYGPEGLFLRGTPVPRRPRNLSQAPDGVDVRENVLVLSDCGNERPRLSAAGEFELCGEADAHVGVPEEAPEFLVRAPVHPLAHQLSRPGDDRLFRRGRVRQVVNAAPRVRLPSRDPVADVEAARVTELHV